jgi:hypothetical protein
MHGFGQADVFFILQVPGNKADAVPCEGLLKWMNLQKAAFQTDS